MDPVSALGVAAASLQFLDASMKFLALCKEVREGADLSTTRNHQIEDNARTIKNLRNDLKISSVAVPTRISNVAKECADITDELLEVLGYVRGNGKSISTGRAAYRAFRRSGVIEALQNTLEEKQRILDSAINQDIWERCNMIEIQQSTLFSLLKSNVQELINDLVTRHQEEHTELRKDIHSLYGATKSEFEALQLRETERDEKERMEKSRDKFLASLSFSEINERRDEIHDAAPNTLDWIFSSRSLPKLGSNQNLANFNWWLRESSQAYWISGKAGSGKSTLMAHLVDNNRTSQGLEIWAGNKSLCLLAYYFWRPGAELQKSIVGLLRSLLFDICQDLPELIPQLSSLMKIRVDSIPTWTSKRLVACIKEAVRLAADTRYCVFIDGLDEFEGDLGELVDLILDFQQLDNVKCCIASRPEIQLVHRLSGLPQLRLQDLNKSDIRSFVSQRLKKILPSETTRQNMIHEIVNRAEGVFLWATLVCRSLIHGAVAGDEEAVLWKRITTTPQDMSEMLAHMLKKVEDLHKDGLSFYLQCMKLQPKTPPFLSSIGVITIARVRQNIKSYGEFERLCEQTETQIVAQSCGLLEIADHEIWMYGLEANSWGSSEEQFVNCPSPTTWRGKRSSIQDVVSIPPRYQAMLKYENRKPVWLHRSAYDMFFDPTIPCRFPLTVGIEEVQRRIWEAAVLFIAVAPSCPVLTPSGKTMMLIRMGDLIASTSGSYMHAHQSETVKSVMNKLLEVVLPCDSSEFLDDSGIWKPQTPQSQNPTSGAVAFWNACVEQKLWDYILSHVEDISHSEDIDYLVPRLLATIFSTKFVRGYDHDFEKNLLLTIARLLELILGFLEELQENSSKGSTMLCVQRNNHQDFNAFNTISCTLPCKYLRDLSWGRRISLIRLAQTYWEWLTSLLPHISLETERDQVTFLFNSVVDSIDLHVGHHSAGLRLLLQIRRQHLTESNSFEHSNLTLFCLTSSSLHLWNVKPSNAPGIKCDVQEGQTFFAVHLSPKTIKALETLSGTSWAKSGRDNYCMEWEYCCELMREDVSKDPALDTTQRAVASKYISFESTADPWTVARFLRIITTAEKYKS